MTPDLIAAKVAKGYGIAGKKLGLPHAMYRASAPTTAALDPSNLMGITPFISSATPLGNFASPSKYGAAIRYALVDTSAILTGDYIDGPSGTYFFASINGLEIPMVVECNAVVSIARPHGNLGTGAHPYGGRTDRTDAPLINRWPVSMLLGGRAIAGHADLPGDVANKGYIMLMPAAAGVNLRTSDRMTDERGREFVISAAELTALGYRCELVLSVT